MNTSARHSKKCFGRILVCLLVAITIFAAAPSEGMAMGDNDSIASGAWGTCPCVVTADKALIIGPGEGVNRRHYPSTFWVGVHCESPWSGQTYPNSIKRVETLDGVKAPKNPSEQLRSLLIEMADISSLDTSNTEKLVNLFDGCSDSRTSTEPSIQVPRVESMKEVISGRELLTSIDSQNMVHAPIKKRVV